MASIIINEGSGPRRVELRGTVTLGSNPACDVVLDHPTAMGCRIELVPKRYGYRVTLVKGEMLLNEQSAEMADLEHNDTLRLGEVLLLYKQPEGDAFEAVAAPAAHGTHGTHGTHVVEILPDGQQDEIVDDDEFDAEIEALEPVAPPAALDDAVERARLKRLEALRRVQLAEAGAAIDDLPDLSAPGALLEAAALDADDERALSALSHEHGLDDATFKEILAFADREASKHATDQPLEVVEFDELEELDLLDEPTSEPPPELDEALVRAQLKRLAALDVFARAQAGGPRVAIPDLSDPAVLDAMRALQASGGAEALLALEGAEQLEDETPRVILARAERLWDEREAAERAAQEAAAAAAAAAEIEALEELETLEELDVEELDELEELEAAEAHVEVEQLEALDELEPIDAPAPGPATPSTPIAAAFASRGSSRAPTAPSRPGRGTPARAPSVPARGVLAVAAGMRVAPPVGARGPRPADARPLPPEGIVFTRPLPPGRAAPTFLPPSHPGSPPA